ncbi:chromosome segregation DNA-binding protein [Thermosyntropha lipolytica DSM 11003]|uniref:Chromosome segregation DNA-binding protein n=1 Tax=Thermosyntropha lipolytica DSM 11003 TaxID=1123382 RepID=A0A1M5RT60_9FIRM|nr:ParB/RepB/Spo0J family partition protein [Thermosyntropha lipolytica]SHH29380.1 chromosome segregation DNA-binding protein [Thermosyntropha lipolytica DSM 11003]
MKKKERGLGKGLEALFGDAGIEAGDELKVVDIPLDDIFPRADQPRQVFDEEKLAELAASIKENGVLQPILVRSVPGGYEIVAGERRFKAAKMAGLTRIPALVKEIADEKAAEIALIENLQREDLNPVEEARALKNMLERFGYTQEELAERLGKSRAYIANAVRLLNLPPEVLKFLEEGKLTAGHARALLAIEDAAKQIAMAREIVEKNLSVRKVEKKAAARRKRADEKIPELVEVEEKLQDYLGTRVKVTKTRRGGKIEINYYSEDDLQRILELWGIIG